MNTFRKLLFVALCVALSCNLLAQKVSDLENKIQNIRKEIALANDLLIETRKDKQTSLNELNILQSQLTQRENLIATLQRQLLEIESNIQRLEHEITRIQSELRTIRSEYARMIEFAYKNRDAYNRLVFLFSADDFNQAFRRLRYLQQYTDFRKDRIKKIEEVETRLTTEVEALKIEKKTKSKLLETENKEQVLLNTERAVLDKKTQQLEQKEQEIRSTIREKEREAQRLQKTIENSIAEEVKKSQKTTINKPTSNTNVMQLTPEERALSNAFANNKGKLPWPTERGIIAIPYGERQHPVLKKVRTTNNGINIAAPKGTEARAVFEGVVTSVNKITEVNNAVIIRHGNYFTVYSNLETVYVKKGDKVKLKEPIGKIHTDKAESKTELHFELWKDRTIIDPTNWLAR
ncbi:MAG: peptidoglycan DD-metalloendopeptidase family protein [Lentimicrobiaceae bacterium]|jgi:septal ring factor EnvC (AmiA/AmiB activator)|nr:peptidoglycan DD-metalloendopeptidase family protein [Lentimicrobiaceae bacterium]